MPSRRHLAPPHAISGDALSAAMAGIGMNLAAAPALDPNLEDTLYFASEEGLLRDDLRTLSMLTTWLSVHAERLGVARLARLVRMHPSPRVRAYWASVGAWPAHKGRLARLADAYAGPRLELLAVGTAFHLRRHGEDPRFADGPLVVPANVLRDRPSDVLSPAELAARHGPYRYRVLVGPGPRADLLAALEADPSLSTSALARRAYSTFALASEVKRDWAIVHPESVPSSRRARVA
jgi:hypothetical protein